MTGTWERARRLLAVRLDNMGDVLMTGPALRALKRLPGAPEITLMCSPGGAAAAGLMPEVDRRFIYAAPWMKATRELRGAAGDRECIARLKRLDFDAAIIFTVYSQNPLPAALMCHLAEIPVRLAYCRENPYQLLTHWVKEEEPHLRVRHEVRRQLDLAAAAGAVAGDEALRIGVPKEARQSIRRRLAALGLAGRPWVLVHPGASAPSRRYPADSFAAVARGVRDAMAYPVLFSGAPGERELIASIRDRCGEPAASMTDLSLAELAALIGASRLLISNNTGPVHLAAAVGTPVVDVYALTNPQHTPWRVPHRVLFHDVPCKFCYRSVCPEGHHRCLRGVPPSAVIEAVASLLLETEPAAAETAWEPLGSRR